MRFPIFIENSKIPFFLSFFSPITINAINLVFFVFSRREVDEQTRTHETIHFKQWMELLIVGFAPLYLLCWFILLCRKWDGELAYRLNPFEMEAYEYQHDPNYPTERPWFGWTKFLWTLRE